ncbi:MAG: RNA-binding protein [Bacteroidia bacterium]|nr:RNA-binding protein [Bacteroidia bacterium]
MNIYVANINFRANDDNLKEVFEAFGEVSSAKIISDKFTGKSRGFGFVEMPNEEEGKNAVEQLNGIEMMEKTLTVNEARPKTEGGFSGGSGGYGGGGRSNGGGGGYNKRY